MQKEPATLTVPGRPQPGNLPLNAELDFRGVTDQQVRPGGTVPRRLPVRSAQGLKRDLILIKESIGGLEVLPLLQLCGGGAIGMPRELYRHFHRSSRSTFVMKVTRTKL